MPIVIHDESRNPFHEAERLMAFAKEHPDLQYLASTLRDAARVQSLAHRYVVDEAALGWKLYFDQAARLWRKAYGWTPMARCRKLAAKAMAIAVREEVAAHP